MDNCKIFGYVRVSTTGQKLDRQKNALMEYGVAERDIVEDKISGKNFNRAGYQTLKNSLLRKGDTLVVKELDRLGRNMEQIKIEWNELIEKGVNIVVLDTPILNTNNKNEIEKKLISNIVFELLSYMAEKERTKILHRQKEGIESAKKKGVKFGRKRVEYPTLWEMYYTQWKSGKITARECYSVLELNGRTFYRMVKRYEENMYANKNYF